MCIVGYEYNLKVYIFHVVMIFYLFPSPAPNSPYISSYRYIRACGVGACSPTTPLAPLNYTRNCRDMVCG